MILECLAWDFGIFAMGGTVRKKNFIQHYFTCKLMLVTEMFFG